MEMGPVDEGWGALGFIEKSIYSSPSVVRQWMMQRIQKTGFHADCRWVRKGFEASARVRY